MAFGAVNQGSCNTAFKTAAGGGDTGGERYGNRPMYGGSQQNRRTKVPRKENEDEGLGGQSAHKKEIERRTEVLVIKNPMKKTMNRETAVRGEDTKTCGGDGLKENQTDTPK